MDAIVYIYFIILLFGLSSVYVLYIENLINKKNAYKFYYKLEENKQNVLRRLFIFSFSIGFIVYYFIYNLSVLQSLYYSLSLFAMDLKTPVELGLSNDVIQYYTLIYIAGFLALLTTSLTVVLVFFKNGIHSLHANHIAKDKSHIVICGLGENNHPLVNNLIKNNKDVEIIVIEKNKDNPFLNMYKNKPNVVVLEGDAEDEKILEKAGVLQCKYVVISTGSDIVNLSILFNIRKYENKKKDDSVVKVYIHVNKRDSEIFFNEEKFIGNNEQSNDTYFYSYNELASRILFKGLPLIEGVDTVNSDDQVHILIIGFGDLGQEIALQAAHQGHFYNKRLIKISVIDTEQSTFDSFRATHWNLDEVCEFNTKVCKIDSPEFYKLYSSWYEEKNLPSYVVFTLGDDELTFSSLSLYVHRLKQGTLGTKIPNIAVRFKKEVSNKIIDTYEIDPRVVVFGETSSISNEECIVDEGADNLAKKINEKYCESKGKPIQEWNQLTNFLKDSNRATADHIYIKNETLKSLEAKKKIQDSTLNDFLELLNTEGPIEKESVPYKLIDMEHRRWNAFHLLYGWEKRVLMPESDKNKDEAKKLHECLVSTKELEKIGVKREKDKYHYYKNDLNNFLILKELKEEENNGN